MRGRASKPGADLHRVYHVLSKVDAAREEASFQEAQNYSKAGKLLVALDKAHADHDGSPQQSYACEMHSWADLYGPGWWRVVGR